MAFAIFGIFLLSAHIMRKLSLETICKRFMYKRRGILERKMHQTRYPISFSYLQSFLYEKDKQETRETLYVTVTHL